MNEMSLPRVSFAGRQIGRMLLGGNPFSGFGHHPNIPDYDRRLREYFTDEKILETMIIAYRAGINGFHLRGDQNVFRWLANFRSWAASQPDGPQLNWLAQSAPDCYPEGRPEGNLEAMAKHGPMAIYIHGGTSDKLYCEDRPDELKKLVRFIKSLGFPAGIGSHRPEVIRLAHEREYGADFYILSLRSVDDEPAVCENEQLAAETFRTIPTQMVAIKTLAAGRLPPAEAFRYAAHTLKPTDLITVGMRDYEVAENVRLAAAAFKEVET